jgi:hypothetical protein
MNSRSISVVCCAELLLLVFSGTPAADGQLHWRVPKKEPIEVRLIALAVAYPKSSFFSNDEVFVAEQELAKEESRFIKLVYDFLPYQPPLSVSMDYSLVYTFHAVRDTSCDESLWEMRALHRQQRNLSGPNSQWKYAAYSPIGDLDRRQARLRCYRTTSDDYDKAMRTPTNEIPY